MRNAPGKLVVAKAAEKPWAVRRAAKYLTVLMLGVIAADFIGCNQGGESHGKTNQGKSKSGQGMFKSTGQFSKGYQEGMKEAQKSWTDWNAGRIWRWTADAEYKKGYDRGWSDGRTVAKLKANAQKQQGERHPLAASSGGLKQAQAQHNESSMITPEQSEKQKGSKQ